MSKLRKSARDKDCTVMLFPYCNQRPETVVLGHLNSPDKGVARKSPDWFGVRVCSSCHDIIDGRVQTGLTKEEIQKALNLALYRTWSQYIDEGLIKIG